MYEGSLQVSLADSSAHPLSATTVPFKCGRIQAAHANTGNVKVGGPDAQYFELAAGESIPLPPLTESSNNPRDLMNLYVKGASGQVVNVFYEQT